MQTLGGGQNEAISGKDRKRLAQLFLSGSQASTLGGAGVGVGLWQERSWSKIHEFKPGLPRQGCLHLSTYTVFTKSDSKWLSN